MSPRRRHSGRAGAAAHRHRAAATRELTVLEQLGGPAERRRSATAREWAARPPGDVDRPQRDRRALPARRARCRACCPTTRSPTTASSPSSRSARSRWPRWRRDPASCCGTSARVGQHRDRMVPQRTRLPAVAFERDEQRRKRIAANARGVRRARSRCAVDAPERIRRRAAPVGDLRRRRAHRSRACSTPASNGSPAGGRLVANAVTAESEAVARAVVFATTAASCADSSTTAASRSAGSPGGGRDARHAVVGDEAMTVYFIGAGPGAADLITVRGQRLLSRCPVCLYAGLDHARRPAGAVPAGRAGDRHRAADARRRSSTDSPTRTPPGLDVARLHSGDPSIYSALAEQCRRLDALGVDYEIVPGRTGFRRGGRGAGPRTDRPRRRADRDADAGRDAVDRDAAGEDLATLSAPGATLVLHLAAAQIDAIVPQLLAGGYRAETPCAVVAFASWPQEMVLRCTLADLADRDACGRHHQDRGDRRRRRAGRRGLHRQLPVLGRPAPAGTALMRVLLLGGTAEARALAARLHPDVEVDQLAGRPGARSRAAGRRGAHRRVRRCRRACGAGWPTTGVDAVVDATHPFAATHHRATPRRRAASCGLPHRGAGPSGRGRPATPSSCDSDAEAAKAVAAERLFAGLPDHRPVGCRRRSPTSTRGS